MKKIFLALAAVTALASCVDEKNIAPEQTGDNLVTIKALATKTTLNGTDVVWEADDAIKVVFNSSETQYVADFATTDAGETAVFTGSLDAAVTSDACGETGYAVYPATVAIESDGKIPFAVSSIQDGKVTTGENLSYATVSLSKIKATGSDEAVFHNALSMLQITVPEGVKKVTVSTNKMQDDAPAYPDVALAGKAPFFYTEGSLQINEAKWGNSGMELDPGTEQIISVDYKLKSVVLKNADDSELAAGVHYVQVFPGTHEGLTVTVEGAGFSYTKVIDQSFTFVASQYHPLNITNIFNLGSTSYAASPFGGIVEIPVITTVDEYEVTIPAEATWLTKTPSAKGAFHKDIVSFTAAANTTGAERAATVTINGVEVVISQKGYVPELLGEYRESFVRSYGQATETGSFEIKATDDANKGVYIVDGILGGQKVYADYASNVLTCYYGSSSANFTVSADFSQISATNGVSLGSISIYPSSNGGKYTAVRAQGAPTLTAEEEALVGTYNESWKYQKSYGATVEDVTSNNGMMISASDEAAYGRLKVTFLSKGGSYTCYANLSGSSLNVLSSGANHASYGAAQHDIEMSISEGVLSFSSLAVLYNYNYGTISDYTATKVETSGGAVTAEDLIGTWHEEFMAGGSYSSDLMEISATDDASKGQLKVRMFNFVPTYSWQSSYALECYADYDEVSATLTVKSNNVMYNGSAVFGDMPMIVTSDGSTITISFSSLVMVGDSVYGMPLGSLVATKQ